jgi:hypothetical protein
VEAVRLEYVKTGMLIRSKNGANIVYVVTANYGTRLTAVRSVDITNPNEWEVDDDILDYEVGIVFRVQLNDDVRLSGKARSIIVPENVDVEQKTIWLKAR